MKGGAHRDRCWYHWEGQLASRVMPPRLCPNGRVPFNQEVPVENDIWVGEKKNFSVTPWLHTIL